MVTDQLGTPRMILDQTGTLAGVSRHDYLPFGEELLSSTGVRNTVPGYFGTDVRQKFTSKERDDETGRDYFLARYYSSTQGRFTSPDEFTGGPDELYDFVDEAADNPTFYADLSNPQSLNKYQYAYNNPLNLVDPDGHCPKCAYDPQGPSRVIGGLLDLGNKALDVVQTGISVYGLVPGAGDVGDLVNAGISVARGNYGSAALDVGGAVTGPVLSAVALGNRVRKLGKLAREG
jgi:RHS repeat-associated protein